MEMCLLLQGFELHLCMYKVGRALEATPFCSMMFFEKENFRLGGRSFFQYFCQRGVVSN